MLRTISLALAAMLSTSAYAQGPMHDTWDINAPNGEQMALGKPVASTAAASNVARAPMQDTWDINAPNGDPLPAGPLAVATAPAHEAVHGHAAPVSGVDRVIEVRPDTRHVNVTSGETVLFKVGAKSFAWTFDATLDHPSFELSRIAPEGVLAQGVRIYCAPTDYERAG